MNIQESILYIDIETSTPNGKPDPSVDIPKYIGLYGIQEKEWVVLDVQKDADEIKKFIAFYDYIAGHNIEGYDIPVLERFGFSFDYKIIIDTYQIVDRRFKTMLYIDLAQGERSLRSLCERLGLQHQKGDFEYDLLNKPEGLSPVEYEEMKQYCIGDLLSGTDLLQYLYDLFYGFREFMDDKSIRYMSWLKCSPGAVAYKTICNLTGLPEKYNESGEDKTKDDKYAGGYVALPEYDMVEGDIYVFDYNSLYPHCYLMGNLYSQDKLGWGGSGIIPSVFANSEDGIVGTYSRTPGVIEQTIQKLYNRRAKLKKQGMKGGQELAIKIILNTIYGISGSTKFISVYNKTTAADCCSMGRRLNKHGRSMFQAEGYEVLYSDTDSYFVKDPFHNEDKIIRLAEKITEAQKKSANIPISTHRLEMEAKLKRIYFFKRDLKDGGGYAKKFYIYVNEDDKITIKGLRLIKGDCSRFARMIYDKYIENLVLDGKPIIFKAETLYNIVKLEVQNNVDLLTKRFRLKDVNEYKDPNGFHASLSKRYGSGEIHLINNKGIGVGKGVKYALVDEMEKKYGKDKWWKKVRVASYVDELKSFIRPEERNQVDVLDRKREK